MAREAPGRRAVPLRTRARYSGAMDRVIASGIALLGVAMVVAIVARRLRLPYTVGLVRPASRWRWRASTLGLALTHDVIFDVILPPLLFEAALNISLARTEARSRRRCCRCRPSACCSAPASSPAGLVWALGWPLAPALAFGALIAATDPIAVIAMLRETGVKGRLRLVIESESLLNDGVAALLFALVARRAQPDAARRRRWRSSRQALLIGGGGLAIGAAVGGAGDLARRTHRRPPRRDRADRGRRLWLVPRRRAFRRLGRAGDGRGRADDGQSRRARRAGRPLRAQSRRARSSSSPSGNSPPSSPIRSCSC